MKIKVEQKHIDHGRKFRCRECPTALALRDAGLIEPAIMWRDDDNERIVCATYYQSNGRRGFRARGINLPDSVAQFVMAFDAGLHVEPFEFEINI